MSPEAGLMLVEEIMPLIQGTVPGAVKPVNSEDGEELVQDTLASAAAMLDAAERAGKPLYPKGVAYYAIQRAKTGRRSMYAGVTDPLSPAAQIQRSVTVSSMDASRVDEDGQECGGLHEVLAGKYEDPSQQAARELDWAELLLDMNERDLALLRCTAQGGKLNVLARKYGISSARLTQLKHEIGAQVKLRWGEDALADAIREPSWRCGTIRAQHERNACRHERRIAV